MDTRAWLLAPFVALALIGCDNNPPPPVDGGPIVEDGGRDAGRDGGRDAGPRDGGGDAEVPEDDAGIDAGDIDGGDVDGGDVDGGMDDGGIDAGDVDGGVECTSDAECDDSMLCNGIETCVMNACVAGTAIDADKDGVDACDDCDDANPAVNPGETEICNGVDDDCDAATDEDLPTTFYRDCDADMWAEIGAPTASGCTPPAPDTECGTTSPAWTAREPMGADYDCGDEDARAHSGVTMFYTTPIMETDFLEFPFDFDCDGVEEPEVSTVGSCTVAAGGCTTVMGWTLAAPACGDAGLFITGCTGVACTPTTMTRTQACH